MTRRSALVIICILFISIPAFQSTLAEQEEKRQEGVVEVEPLDNAKVRPDRVEVNIREPAWSLPLPQPPTQKAVDELTGTELITALDVINLSTVSGALVIAGQDGVYVIHVAQGRIVTVERMNH